MAGLPGPELGDGTVLLHITSINDAVHARTIGSYKAGAALPAFADDANLQLAQRIQVGSRSRGVGDWRQPCRDAETQRMPHDVCT